MRKLQALQEGEAGHPRSSPSLHMQPNPITTVTAAHSPQHGLLLIFLLEFRDSSAL